MLRYYYTLFNSKFLIQKSIPYVVQNVEDWFKFLHHSIQQSHTSLRSVFLQEIEADGNFQVEPDGRVPGQVLHLED